MMEIPEELILLILYIFGINSVNSENIEVVEVNSILKNDGNPEVFSELTKLILKIPKMVVFLKCGSEKKWY